MIKELICGLGRKKGAKGLRWLLGLLLTSFVVIGAAEKAPPLAPRIPAYDAGKVTLKEFAVINPTSNAKLWARIQYPADAGPQKQYPAVVIAHGGLGFGSQAPPEGNAYFASQGFVVAVFDPDGRGKSEGKENYNGMVQQDGLNALFKYIAALDFVQKDNIGLMTTSLGVALGAGALARHPGNPSIKYFIDNEGPTDRFYITKNNDPQFLSVFGHNTDEADWWKEREAVVWGPKIPCRYLRMQQVLDHVHKENKQHAIDIINAVTNTQYGGKGISPWTRVNGPNDNPPNKVYTADNPPKWIEVVPQDKLLEHDIELIKEMAGMPSLEAAEKKAEPAEAQKKAA